MNRKERKLRIAELRDIVLRGYTTEFYEFILKYPNISSGEILDVIVQTRDWLPGLAILEDSIDIWQCLLTCARFNRVEMSRRCLDNGGDPMFRSGLVIVCAAREDACDVLRLFHERGYDLHFRNEKVLIAASYAGAIKTVCFLCGLPETNIDAGGGVVLEYAVRARNIELFDAVMAREPDAVVNGFLCAVDKSNFVAIERLLVYRSWLINCEDGEPLKLAVYNRDDSMVRFLLNRGAKSSVLRPDGLSYVNSVVGR